jgi:hypothetical protein
MQKHISLKLGLVALVMLALLGFGSPIASAAPPSNDDIGAAISISSFPFNDMSSTVAATAAYDDPSTCSTPVATVWYSITSASSAVINLSTNGSDYNTVVSVFTRSGGSLSQITCGSFGTSFNASAGQAYLVMIGAAGAFGPYPGPATGGQLVLNVTATPPPNPFANASFTPFEPSTFDTVQFLGFSFDPFGVGIQTEAWSFGDGATTTGCCVSHRYAADGDYLVRYTVITLDGRSASSTLTAQVRTRDIGITKLSTPTNGRAGQTTRIIASIVSQRATESVVVQLFKSDPANFDGFQLIGTLTQTVPQGKQAVPFSFNYTFTPDDARIGKVTFKAVATPVNGRDALPGDNTLIAPVTKITR